ncbi:MAG: MATE family efflux transporter [Eubacteriales bacterium]|nr:MATE family efflux transporter [Eubacteriales bacterium]
MKENCLKQYGKYTFLNVLGMIGLSCYILADTYFVAKGLGSSGLAALNLAIPVYSLIHGTGMMLGMGGATRYSIAKSQGQTEKGNRIFSNVIFMAGGFAVLFILLGIFASSGIARLLGGTEETFTMCRTYLRVLLVCSPVFMLNNIILCFVRNDGEPQRSMAAMLTGSFSNIILDYIFIFPFHMGIFGAVVATSLAPVISLCVLAPFFIKKKNSFHFVKNSFGNGFPGKILASGVPSFVGELSSGIVIVVFNLIMLKLRGNIGVAAYGVVANISCVVISVFNGIAQGIQPLISQYYGMEKRREIQKIYHYALCTVGVLSIIIYAGIFIWANGIAAAFNSEGNMELQKIAVYGMKLYFTACAFAGFNIVTMVYFTSTDVPKPANIISFMRGFLLIIPMAFLLSALFETTGLWLAFPATEFVVACIGVILYGRRKRAWKKNL